MSDGTDGQPKKSWLKQIHEDNPSSRILSFGYDKRHTDGRLYTMGRIRGKALQLLDELVKLRRVKGLSSVCKFLTIDLSVVEKRANVSFYSIRVVRYCSSATI